MFGLHKMDKGNTPIRKQMPASSGTFHVGEVAVISSGRIAKASDTTVPTYVIVEDGTKTTADTITVEPIYKDQLYKTTLSTAGSLAVGVKYTIADNSAQVTATSTSGVATVVETLGSTSGSVVFVKFE